MDERIETSTPLIFNKFIPPPPRRLWSADSPTEQLYRIKWSKYRDSLCDRDPWNALDSPHFVDFKDLPDIRDNFFDIDEERNSTSLTFETNQLPGSDVENNNLIQELQRCTLSVIQREDDPEKTETNDKQTSKLQISKTIRLIAEISTTSKNVSATCENNDAGTIFAGTDQGKNIQSEINATKKGPDEKKIDKKGCTIVEPFSFETREKYRQEHHQARRERDSFGQEMRKGFRATPLPHYLKIRDRVDAKAKSCTKSKPSDKNIGVPKSNVTDVWKRKGFQPLHVKRSPTVPKAPNLLTASRAKQRHRFEEELKRKEQERQEAKRKEEAERKKREEEEIAKLRRELVHKAQPIRRYKFVPPRVTKRELSEPTAPTDPKRPRKF